MSLKIPTEKEVHDFSIRYIYDQIYLLRDVLQHVLTSIESGTPDDAAVGLINILSSLQSDDQFKWNLEYNQEEEHHKYGALSVKEITKAAQIWETLYIAMHEEELVNVRKLVESMPKIRRPTKSSELVQTPYDLL